MRVTVRFAGHFRSLTPKPVLTLDLADGATVEEALLAVDHQLEGRLHALVYAAGGELQIHPDVLLLVDTRPATPDEVLAPGSVLAIVPPMAGG